jgi:hypothetical protein
MIDAHVLRAAAAGVALAMSACSGGDQDPSNRPPIDMTANLADAGDGMSPPHDPVLRGCPPRAPFVVDSPARLRPKFPADIGATPGDAAADAGVEDAAGPDGDPCSPS